MFDQAAHERSLKLAPQGLCECKVCHRVGPLNGAMVTWWAGLPFHALCPDCFGIGRQVLMTRHFEGIEAKVLEQSSGGRIVLPTSVGEANMAQTKLNRSPSKGW